jgi:hypothetical protein
MPRFVPGWITCISFLTTASNLRLIIVRDSKGSMAEVDNAWELGIPVFEHLLALMDWDTDPNSLSDGIKPSHNGVK